MSAIESTVSCYGGAPPFFCLGHVHAVLSHSPVYLSVERLRCGKGSVPSAWSLSFPLSFSLSCSSSNFVQTFAVRDVRDVFSSRPWGPMEPPSAAQESNARFVSGLTPHPGARTRWTTQQPLVRTHMVHNREERNLEGTVCQCWTGWDNGL